MVVRNLVSQGKDKVAKRRRAWIYSQPKRPKPKVSENVKLELKEKVNAFVEGMLKPAYIKPPPEDTRLNYLTDIYTKWYGRYFYFCAKYHVPGPNAITPFFEAKFARLEYIGNGRFNLAYMRHAGKWVEVYTNLSADECLTLIKDEPLFCP